MHDLDDLSLATRMFHSSDLSELIEAICDDAARDDGAADQARPAMEAERTCEVAIGDDPIETAAAVDVAHAQPLQLP